MALSILGLNGLAVGSEGVTIAILTGILVSLIVGILAGCVPAWQAARTPIITALRDA